jgi:hypothetical protein
MIETPTSLELVVAPLMGQHTPALSVPAAANHQLTESLTEIAALCEYCW